jgi:hypothetical protein
VMRGLLSGTSFVMTQAITRIVTIEAVMRSCDFKAGVEDVRAGRAARFDGFEGWEYERGRQWAMLAPLTMKISIRSKLNPRALALLRKAFARGDIL